MSDTLSDGEKQQVTARADQFQQTLARDGAADWEPFLAGLVGPARVALLVELVARDLNFRWLKGERPVIEDYLARYPELGPADRVPPALILVEHRCRTRTGEPTDPSQYRARFPAQFDALQTGLEAADLSGTVRAEAPPRWTPMAQGTVEVAQQYELVRELGRGMFGEVWLARKRPSGIERAIKILLQAADRDASQRELKSLELIKNLRHPYLLATEDFWITGNRLHIVMELAEGTLRGLLKQHLGQGRPGIPVEELFQYLAESAEGLDFLHSQKITHRDVKPDNILILHGHAKVADFGLARAQTQLVESMSLAGTPAYMAPEIWAGEGGPASDLYSLAFAYVELRQGRSPLRPRPLVELMIAHQEGRYEFTDTVTEPERAVLRTALSARPQDRYPACTDFAAALAEALGLPFAGLGRRNAVRGAPTNPPAPVYGSAGAFESGSLPMPVETEGVGGTMVIDSLRKHAEPEPLIEAEPLPEEPEATRRAWPLIVGGTVALLALVAFGVWAVTSDRGRTVSTGTADVVQTAPTTTVPIVPKVNPKPPETVPSKPPDPLPKKEPDPAPELVYPKGTTPEPGKDHVPLSGKLAPRWVFVDREGEKVRFRLISAPAHRGVPFYIMETKVTEKLYRGAGNPVPVMNVTALEAQELAQKVFGGDLPSEEEWDSAAGFHDRQEQAGPTRAGGRAWIGKDAPGPVKRGADEADVNAFGLLDMAGNGREWTRTVLTRTGARKVLGADELGATDKVILRGRSFTLDSPLTFEMLEVERTKQPQAATPTVGSPFTGFRVVLKLP